MQHPLTERHLHEEFFKSTGHNTVLHKRKVVHDEDTVPPSSEAITSLASSDGNSSTATSPASKHCWTRHNPINKFDRAINVTVENLRFWRATVVPFYWNMIKRYVARRPSGTAIMYNNLPGVVTLWQLLRVFRDYIFGARSKEEEEDRQDIYPSKELVRYSWFNDLLCGCSVGAMSIPQGMSYAQLTGVAIEYGLHNNMIYPAAYALFGTARQAVAGTAAVENIMIGESITSILGEDASLEQRHNTAVLLTLLMAVNYAIFRIFHLAVLADLLADPVLSGFSSAAALIVGSSQLKHVFGVTGIANDWEPPTIWLYILRHFSLIHWGAAATALMSIIFLYLIKKISKKYLPANLPAPGPLLLVVFGSLISYLSDLKGKYGISIVGDIAGGLPHFFWPSATFTSSDSSLDSPYIWDVELQALKIACLFFIIHIAVVKSIATRNRYEIVNKQELFAFAGTDAIGGVLGCYPACTSMSRTCVTDSLAAKTQLHGFGACVIVMITLLCLTTPLGYLPSACLGAVVIFGVSRMFELSEMRRLYRLQKASWAAGSGVGAGNHAPDFLLWIVAFFATLFFDSSTGIIVSVCLSLLLVGRKLVRPDCIELGRLPGTECYRNIDRFRTAETNPMVRILRFDAPLNFANAKYLEHRLKKACREFFVEKGLTMESVIPDGTRRHPVLLLDCSSIVQLDTTAISCLERAHVYCAQYGIILAYSNWKGPQRDFLACASFYTIVPPEHCFLSTYDAVNWALQGQINESSPANEMNNFSRLNTHIRIAELESH